MSAVACTSCQPRADKGDQDLTCKELAAVVDRELGLSVHPRSVERALSRRRVAEGAPKSG